MLLRLTSTEALARASFAGASVAVAFIGHSVTHAHHDMPRLLIALLALLGVVWGTRRRDLTLGAAVAAQVLVHGGIPTSPHMLAIHAAAVAVAYLLMRNGERIWHALADLCLGRLPRGMVALRAITIAPILRGHDLLVPRLAWPANAMRAPPALA